MTEWITVNEAVTESGYSSDHIYLLCRQNRINHRRIQDKFIEIDREDLLRHKKQAERFGGGPRPKKN